MNDPFNCELNTLSRKLQTSIKNFFSYIKFKMVTKQHGL